MNNVLGMLFLGFQMFVRKNPGLYSVGSQSFYLLLAGDCVFIACYFPYHVSWSFL